MLPSDPGYTPAATDERVRQLPVYHGLLALNMDPYAEYSRNENIIRMIEEFLR